MLFFENQNSSRQSVVLAPSLEGFRGRIDFTPILLIMIWLRLYNGLTAQTC